MLLVISSRYDHSASALVEQWRHLDARLLTCLDLSTAGWRYYPGDPGNSRAVVGGEIVPFEHIAGALICIPAITKWEVVHIEPSDRGYVAAEMNAFLTAWLSEATFPVVNRPTPSCLMGPNWSQTRWIREAVRAGLQYRMAAKASSRRDSPRGPSTGHAVVTVVGDRCFGDAAGLLMLQARRLAAAAGVHSLTVVFNGPESDSEFVQAYPAVDLAQTEVATALFDCFPVSAAAFA